MVVTKKGTMSFSLGGIVTMLGVYHQFTNQEKLLIVIFLVKYIHSWCDYKSLTEIMVETEKLRANKRDTHIKWPN
jgi:hypothetical protein